jgi:hypothetical protein
LDTPAWLRRFSEPLHKWTASHLHVSKNDAAALDSLRHELENLTEHLNEIDRDLRTRLLNSPETEISIQQLATTRTLILGRMKAIKSELEKKHMSFLDQ